MTMEKRNVAESGRTPEQQLKECRKSKCGCKHKKLKKLASVEVITITDTDALEKEFDK